MKNLIPSIRYRVLIFALIGLVIVTIAATGLAAWPRQVAALRIARIVQSEPNHIVLTDGYLLDVMSRPWGQTTISVSPLHELDGRSSVELLWLEHGQVRHEVIADRGRLSTITFSVPNEWPLVVATVEYNPIENLIVARRVLADGQVDGFSKSHAPNAPMFAEGIETWGRVILEKARDWDSGSLR